MTLPKNTITFLTAVAILVSGAVFLSAVVHAQEDLAAPQLATTSTTTVPEVVIPVDDTLPKVILETISGKDVAIGDYVVGPGKVELTIKPGETVTHYVSVTNRVSDNRRFTFTAEDMSGSADGKQNVVLLGDQNGPYSMKDFVTFPRGDISIELGQRAQVPVTITMPPNAEPGGYYGAVLVSTVRESVGDSVRAPQSPILARVGTLFFITVPGDAERSAELVSFDTIGGKSWYQSGPVNLQIVYENTGSVHLNPYGEITVHNMLGEEVGFVELDPWFVLPKSLRLRDISWDREMLLGRYTITARINRGYDNVVDESTIAIWVLPWKVIVGALVVVMLVSLLFRLFFRTFEFKRRKD
jgi:hypothetical protein